MAWHQERATADKIPTMIRGKATIYVVQMQFKNPSRTFRQEFPLYDYPGILMP